MGEQSTDSVDEVEHTDNSGNEDVPKNEEQEVNEVFTDEIYSFTNVVLLRGYVIAYTDDINIVLYLYFHFLTG